MAAQPGPHGTRPPFFKATVAKPPQPEVHSCYLRCESTILKRNQAAKIPATEMCAYDSRYAGGGMKPHFRILAAHCARALLSIFLTLQHEGAGNAGRPMRPAVSCATGNKKTHTSIQVTPESPDIPRAMGYGL
jgi:hypothetical protein